MSTSERRYVAKQFTQGRHKLWGVYDQVSYSWPVINRELGQVKQNMKSEAEAQAEADRCEEARAD
jgi:hypothetical protein